MELIDNGLERAFEIVAGTAPQAILIVNKLCKIVYSNPKVSLIFQYTTDELHGMLIERILPEFNIHESVLMQMLFLDEESIPNPEPIELITGITKKGIPFQLKLNVASIQPDVPHLKANLQNTLEENALKSEKDEQTIRLLSFSSAISRAIIKSKTEIELSNQLCRIAVEIGKFEICWVGLPDMVNNLHNPIAHYNATEQDKFVLTTFKFDNNGPTGTVMASGNYYLSNSFEKEPWTPELKNYLWSRGFRSYLVLSLKKHGRPHSTLNVYSNSKTIFTADQIEFLNGIAQDISDALDNLELEKMHTAAIKNQNDTAMLLNQAEAKAHIGSWRINFKTGISKKSDEACRIYGFEPTEDNVFKYEDWRTAVHPDDWGYVKQMDDEAALTLSNCIKFHRIVRPNGEIRNIGADSSFDVDDDGKPFGMHGLVYDLTDKLNSAAALNQSEANLRLIIDLLPQCILLKDINGEFIYANKNYCDLFGMKFEELVEKHWTEIHSSDKYNTINKHDAEVIRSGKATILRDFIFVDAKGNKRYFDVVKSPMLIAGSKKQAILGVLNDITDQKLAEEERVAILDDIVSRNKSLEQFSQMMSHNLRAPVANIMGISSVLELPNLTEKNKAELMEGITKSAHVLDNVIRDMNKILHLRESINVQREVVSFKDLVRELKVSLGDILENERGVIKTDFHEMPEYYSIKSYFHSIFLNLISNSIKFRRINVPPVIDISTKIHENGFELVFCDNGIGIDLEKYRDKIFGLYKRFHTSAEGNGIGLFMVKTQVEALGGSISISSVVNKGTEIRIYFNDNK